MSNRPSFTRSSSMVVNVGEPIPTSRDLSPPPRTTSYHASGSNYGTRDIEYPRQSVPQARRNSRGRGSLPGRVSSTLGSISNKATAGSARTIQPSTMSSSGRSASRGAPVRLHQGLQSTVNRSSQGHRNELYRAEPTNQPQYRYSAPRVHVPAAPTKRSNSRPPTAVHNGGAGRSVDVFGADHVHDGQGLVRVGGSRSIYSRH